MLRIFALYGLLLLGTLMPTLTVVFAAATEPAAARDAGDTNADKTVILVWGDSLSAAYGIPIEQGWVSLLQEKLGEAYQVINGSISGETTIGGLTRLPKALEDYQPDYLLLELGANDGLRGLSTTNMQDNLNQMIEQAQQAGAEVVLLGIRIPPNYGMVYTQKFDQVFSDLASQHEIPLLPFLLDKVALDYDLMQEDGLHPTAEAQPLILENVWPVLEPVLLGETASGRDADQHMAAGEQPAPDNAATADAAD
ncbi:MAG: arylesterase [Thiolinea sp.]